MQLAVDFFPFFHRTAQLLDKDPTTYCVSSWNDNGQVTSRGQQPSEIASRAAHEAGCSVGNSVLGGLTEIIYTAHL